MRLHWHRETELGSGLYVPTNNYFPERAALLRPFKSAAFDAARRAWQLYPVVERLGEKAEATAPAGGVGSAGATAAARSNAEYDGVDGGAKPASAGPPDSGEEELAIGGFVFLRNARFKPETESPAMPRYWVARVTGNVAAVAPTPGGRSPPPAQLPPGQQRQTLLTEDGRLRLQWMRETALGSGLFTATTHIFLEARRLVRLLPGSMRYDSVLQVGAGAGAGAEGAAGRWRTDE